MTTLARFITDGHVLHAHVNDGYVDFSLDCPGEGRCGSGNKTTRGTWFCHLALFFDEDRHAFMECQETPYRTAEFPCEIEHYWSGDAEDTELWWRPSKEGTP